MLKTYHGSCHCGAVRIEADLDLAKGATRCNCSFCRKTRNWSTITSPDKFRISKGEDQVAFYDNGAGGVNSHGFCSHCGVRLFTKGDIPQLGGAYVSVFLPVLDDASEAELIEAPLRWCDGLHNNWMNPPGEVRHL